MLELTGVSVASVLNACKQNKWLNLQLLLWKGNRETVWWGISKGAQSRTLNTLLTSTNSDLNLSDFKITTLQAFIGNWK